MVSHYLWARNWKIVIHGIWNPRASSSQEAPPTESHVDKGSSNPVISVQQTHHRTESCLQKSSSNDTRICVFWLYTIQLGKVASALCRIILSLLLLAKNRPFHSFSNFWNIPVRENLSINLRTGLSPFFEQKTQGLFKDFQGHISHFSRTPFISVQKKSLESLFFGLSTT